MKLLILSRTTMVEPLDFGNVYVIYLTPNWAYDYLSMLGLKLNRVSKRGHWGLVWI